MKTKIIKIHKCKVWHHALGDHGTKISFDNRNDLFDSRDARASSY